MIRRSALRFESLCKCMPGMIGRDRSRCGTLLENPAHLPKPASVCRSEQVTRCAIRGHGKQLIQWTFHACHQPLANPF